MNVQTLLFLKMIEKKYDKPKIVKFLWLTTDFLGILQKDVVEEYSPYSGLLPYSVFSWW